MISSFVIMTHFCNQFFLWYLIWMNCYSISSVVIWINSEFSNLVMIHWCNESWIKFYVMFNLSFQLFNQINSHSVSSLNSLMIDFRFGSKTTSSVLWIMKASVRTLVYASIISMHWSLDNFTLELFMVNTVQYGVVWATMR